MSIKFFDKLEADGYTDFDDFVERGDIKLLEDLSKDEVLNLREYFIFYIIEQEKITKGLEWLSHLQALIYKDVKLSSQDIEYLRRPDCSSER